MLEEMTAREYIEEALILPGSLFSKFKVWDKEKKMITKYKRSRRNLQEELAKNFDNWNVKNVIDGLNINILEFDTKHNSDGYANKDGIAVSVLCDNIIRTTLHEIAHYVMGFDYEDYDLNEAEAETACYIVCKHIGIEDDLSVSRHYIQRYLNGNEFAETSITKCIDAANRIIQAGYEMEV